MQSDLLHFFDVDTGSDYPDGDEWFIVDLLFPYDVKLPDNLKGTDYFTTISTDGEQIFLASSGTDQIQVWQSPKTQRSN